MAILVRVITGEAPAIVLYYPRETDPVLGAELSELAQLPPHFEQDFRVGAGNDLLVFEMPLGAAVEWDRFCAVALMPGFTYGESEAA
ncbi:MAG: hypothetical protein WC692_07430 [Erythrobacter sp.]|jgi:hypothetical protein